MKRKRRFSFFAALAAVAAAFIWWPRPQKVRRYLNSSVHQYFAALPPLKPKSKTAALILAGAKAQQGTVYDAGYQVISYPGGDVPQTQGACTDVVICALRHAGIDLQLLIHQDMKSNFKAYPQQWGLPAPDTNIDHRRVPNQMRFFERKGLGLTKIVSPQTLQDWQPGDLVYWNLGRSLHTGVVSDTRNVLGEPYVIHNGWVCVEDDVLSAWPIIGHYRYPKSALKPTRPSPRRTSA